MIYKTKNRAIKEENNIANIIPTDILVLQTKIINKA